MRKQNDKKKLARPKARFGLPDLDQSKAAVLGSTAFTRILTRYRHATDEFIEWYCSESRLSFNRTAVLRIEFTWRLGIWLQAQSTYTPGDSMPPSGWFTYILLPETAHFRVYTTHHDAPAIARLQCF